MVELINEFFTHNPIFTVSIGISAVIATLVYLLGFSGVLRKEIKRRGMEQHIKKLKDHYILCGFGRVGQQVARELAAEKQPFVIIEKDEANLKLAQHHGWPAILGDVALDESLLKKANVETAKCIIIAVGTDADAVFMAVSARAMNPDIFMVARASSKEAADKLSKIGVNRIALPYQIGGYHMATMALRPSVVDFLDVLVDNEREELEMEEYHIQSKGYYEGKTLEGAAIFKKNLVVVAVRKVDGKSKINPKEDYVLHGGDRLVIMGGADQLKELGQEFAKNQPKKEAEKPAPTPETNSIMSGVTPSPFMKEE